MNSSNLKKPVSSLVNLESDRRFLWTMLGVTLLGVIIRLLFINRSMGYDETFTFINYASQPIEIILTDYRLPNNHVFHTLLVSLSYHLLGNAPWIIRLPAFLAGVLLIPGSYFTALQFHNRYSALLAACLVAVSPTLIAYSTNARGYSLLALLALLILGLAAWLKDHKSRIGWGVFVVLSVLGFYTLPIMLYPFGIVMLWLLASWLFRDTSPVYGKGFLLYWFLSGLLASVATLLLYMPIINQSGLESIIGNQYVTPLDWSVFLQSLPGSLISTWQVWNLDLPVLIGFMLLAGLLISVVFNRKLSRQRVPVPLVAFFWLGLSLFVQRLAPWPRVWLFFLPYFLIWACAGIVAPFQLWMGGKGRRYAVQIGWVFLATCLVLTVLQGWRIYSHRSIEKRMETGVFSNAEPTALFLKDFLIPGDVVLTILPSDYPLRYYFMLHGVDTRHFRLQVKEPKFQRALVVVDQSNDQTIDEILEYRQLSGIINAGAARVIKEFDDTIIFEILR